MSNLGRLKNAGIRVTNKRAQRGLWRAMKQHSAITVDDPISDATSKVKPAKPRSTKTVDRISGLPRTIKISSQGYPDGGWPANSSTLGALAAVRKLLPVRERRLIVKLSKLGYTQTEIARAGDLSQAHVSRTLASVRAFPELLAVTPSELVWQRTAGEITSRQMMTLLLGQAPFSKGRLHKDVWEPGTWDEIQLLHSTGELTPAEFKRLRKYHDLTSDHAD